MPAFAPQPRPERAALSAEPAEVGARLGLGGFQASGRAGGAPRAQSLQRRRRRLLVGDQLDQPAVHPFATLMSRGGGAASAAGSGASARAFPVERVNSFNLQKALLEHVDVKSRIMTDDAKHYPALGPRFEGGHASVNHSKREYVRGDVHTNTVEGFFSLFRRGMVGTFHSVSKHHLHRYADEFAFRYTTRRLEDGNRVSFAIRKARGKRLLYRDHVARNTA